MREVMPIISPPPRSRLASAGRLAIRALIVIAVAWALAHGVRWKDVVAHLRGVSLPLLVAVVALNSCMMSIKAVRLRLLLGSAQATWAGCFGALLTSSALNNLVPLRGGDVARLWM